MKALSKDRAHRYENLDQMNRALVKFLYSTYPEFNASDLKSFADDLFKKEISDDRSKFVEYGKIDIQQYIDDMKKEESRTGKIATKDLKAAKAAKEDRVEGEPRTKVREIELDLSKTQDVRIEIDKKDDDAPTTTKKLSKSAASAVHPGKIPAKTPAGRAGQSSGATTAMKRADRSSSRVTTRDKLKAQEEESKGTQPILILFLAASLAGISYFQSDLVEDLTGFNLKKMIHGNTRTPTSVSMEDGELKTPVSEPLEEKSEIILGGLDINMEVYVDGVKTTYIGKPIKIDSGKDVTVTIKKSGYLPFVTTVNFEKRGLSKVVNVPKMERARIGLLTTSQNYTAGSKLVYESNGEVIEKNLPLRDVAIPQGTYQAKIINPILGTEKKVEFTIEENRKHFLE
jgi:serine/threonine-protein kinase